MTSTVQGKDFIQFLGTCGGDYLELHDYNEGDIANPNAQRALRLGGKNIRHPSALFITPDILTDFTAHTEREMQFCKVRKESIRNLIITHSHFDHFQPMAIHSFASSLPHPLMVHGSMTVRNALDFATMYEYDYLIKNFRITQDNSDIQTIPVVPGETFALGDVKATAVLANHMIDKKYLILPEQALNFVFERAGKTLFYGVDSSFILPRTFEILSRFQFDIVILDGSFGYFEVDPAISGHQNFAMLEKTVSQFRGAKLLKSEAMVIAHHISQNFVEPHDEIVDGLAQKGITLAYDGMTVEF